MRTPEGCCFPLMRSNISAYSGRLGLEKSVPLAVHRWLSCIYINCLQGNNNRRNGGRCQAESDDIRIVFSEIIRFWVRVNLDRIFHKLCLISFVT